MLVHCRLGSKARAARHRIPTMYYQRGFPEVGGLMSIGAYTRKILNGTNPELPIQRSKLELVINLKTAKALVMMCRRCGSCAPTR